MLASFVLAALIPVVGRLADSRSPRRLYALGITPLVVTSLLAAGGGTPWLACGYLVVTGLIGAAATLALRERDLFSLCPTVRDGPDIRCCRTRRFR